MGLTDRAARDALYVVVQHCESSTWVERYWIDISRYLDVNAEIPVPAP